MVGKIRVRNFWSTRLETAEEEAAKEEEDGGWCSEAARIPPSTSGGRRGHGVAGRRGISKAQAAVEVVGS